MVRNARMRGSIALLWLLMISLASTESAADIQADFFTGRVDATSTGSGFRNWTSSDLGLVVSRRDQPISAGTSSWFEHDPGTALVNTKGVAATGFTVGVNVTEIAVYVGIDGKLNIGTVFNGGAISWVSADPPAGKTLTGHIVAVTNVSGGSRFLNVGATTTDSKLYRFVLLLSLGSGAWTDSSAGLSWLPDNPLAATVNASQTIVSIFASHSPNTESLGMLRWNGATWSTLNLGRPANKRACRSIATAQGQISSISGSYKVLVACAPHNLVGEVYIATATSESSNVFTWATFATPGSIAYQSLAAVYHSISNVTFSFVIDVYASAVLQNRLHKGVQGSSNFSISDLGTVPDGVSVIGGMAAVPFGLKSRVFYVGSVNGRRYLYERHGGVVAPNPQNYRALGENSATGLSYDGFLAEGKVSVFGGTMAASVISRPTDGFPTIKFLYSPSDGKALSAAQDITHTVGPTTYEYVVDPTVVVTDQRTMYSVQLGVKTGPVCSATPAKASVYLVSTSGATFPVFSTPIELEAIDNTPPEVSTPIDHPYADIEHRVGGTDRVHVAWWALKDPPGANAGIRYTEFIEGSSGPTAVVTLPSTPGGPPRVTASDGGRVIVYYPLGAPTGNVRVCEINSARNGCEFGWQIVERPSPPDDLFYSSPGSGADIGPGVSGSNIHIRTVYPASMTISEAGDRLYYCFHQTENNGAGADNDTREEVDAYCTSGTRDPVAGWQWSNPRVAIAGVTLDNKDQFAPEVIVTREGANYGSTEEAVIVTYYDRTDDPGNYLYKVKKAVSTDRGITFQPPRVQFDGLTSDAEFLPRHCRHPNVRFIGDYSGAEGDVIHGHSLSAVVKMTGTIGTMIKTNFTSLGNWDR